MIAIAAEEKFRYRGCLFRTYTGPTSDRFFKSICLHPSKVIFITLSSSMMLNQFEHNLSGA